MLERAQYLLRCIREDAPDDDTPSRYEAASELEALFDHVSTAPDAQDTLTQLAALVTEVYLESDEAVRTAIETGFLEHVLEQPKLRPVFAHWADDARLRQAWELSLAWGEAHPNFTKSLRDELRPSI